MNLSRTHIAIPKMPYNDDFDCERTERGSADEHTDNSDVDGYTESFTSPRQQKYLKKLIRTDQFSFLSGQSIPLQATHVIPAIRTARQGAQDRSCVKALKERMEMWLTELWFNGGHRFAMDGRTNFLLLGVGERMELNKFGNFTFFPGEERLLLLDKELEALNADWARRAAADPAARRNIPSDPGSSFDVRDVQWEVLVLYPDGFYSDSAPMHILDPAKRAIRRKNTERLLDLTSSDWFRCVVCTEPHGLPIIELFQEEGRGNAPLRLRHDSLRAADEQLSLFAMIVALHARVAAYCAAPGNQPSEAVRHVLEYTTPLVEKIFYIPPGARRPDEGSNTPTMTTDKNDDSKSAPEHLIVNNLTYSECTTLFKRMEAGEGGAEPFSQLLYGSGGPRFEVPEIRLIRQEWAERARLAEAGA
ncbi:hypothetical protein DFH06DRAFT_1220010 [Mycena polygramma]|nr:hypothetical protein DFH06DRAFT_1220010 [Mycena polygramma]